MMESGNTSFALVGNFNAAKNLDSGRMVQNYLENKEECLPLLKLQRAVFVGSGPSVKDFVDDIRDKQEKGFHVFAMNGAARWLFSNGISPDYHIIYDARDENVQFITEEIPRIGYILASHVSPKVIRMLNDRHVSLVHSSPCPEVVHEIKKHEPESHILGSATSVGLFALNLAIMRGYRIAHLYGYDSSNDGDAKHVVHQSLNDGCKVLEFKFRDKTYFADPAMACQADEFTRIYENYEKFGLNIKVFGYGLLPDMWRAFEERKRRVERSLRLVEETTGETPIEIAEADKYYKMWSVPQYRNWSPGEGLVDTFLNCVTHQSGERIIDFGCGTGRASQKMHDLGYDVIGVDHVANCLDQNVSVKFCIANLWHLPVDLPSSDWGYCCDVMEHIPPEKVSDVLAGISERTTKGAFFSISFVEDNFGKAIGKPLHLTIQPFDWWVEELKKHFPYVHVMNLSNVDGVFLCRHEDDLKG